MPNLSICAATPPAGDNGFANPTVGAASPGGTARNGLWFRFKLALRQGWERVVSLLFRWPCSGRRTGSGPDGSNHPPALRTSTIATVRASADVPPDLSDAPAASTVPAPALQQGIPPNEVGDRGGATGLQSVLSAVANLLSDFDDQSMQSFNEAVETLQVLDRHELQPGMSTELNLIGDLVVMHLAKWPQRVERKELAILATCRHLPEPIRARCREVAAIGIRSAALLAEYVSWTAFETKMLSLVLKSLQYAMRWRQLLPFSGDREGAVHVLSEHLRYEAARLSEHERQRVSLFLGNRVVQEVHRLLERIGPESLPAELDAALTPAVRQSLLDTLSVLTAAFEVLCTELGIARPADSGARVAARMYGITVARESDGALLTRLANVSCVVAVDGKPRRAVVDFRLVPSANWERALKKQAAPQEQPDCLLLTHHDEALANQFADLPLPSSLLSTMLGSTVQGWDMKLQEQDWAAYNAAEHEFSVEPHGSPVGRVTSRVHLTDAPADTVAVLLGLLGHLRGACVFDEVPDETMWARLAITFGQALPKALSSVSDAPLRRGWLGASSHVDCEQDGDARSFRCQPLPGGVVSVQCELRRAPKALVHESGAETALHRPLSSVVVKGSAQVGRNGEVRASEVLLCSVLVACADLDVF